MRRQYRELAGDEAVGIVLRNLDARLREKLGQRYSRAILFGSRARGDYGADSDVDVAVVVRGAIEDRWALTKEVLEETFELLMETGFYIDPQIIEEGALEAPASSINPELTREVLRDGRMLRARLTTWRKHLSQPAHS